MKRLTISIKRIAAILLTTLLFFSVLSHLWSISAEEAKSKYVTITGKTYSFDDKNDYNITGAVASSTAKPYGTFKILGDFSDLPKKSGIPAYLVKGDKISFFYTYDSKLLNTPDEDWHLIDDKCKTVNGIALDDSVGKGLILLQFSGDMKNWSTAISLSNAFENRPTRNSAFYASADIQLINGCFYRLIIAYELAKKTGDGVLGIGKKYDYARYAELYTFYAQNEDYKEEIIDMNHVYRFGHKDLVDDFDSYSGTKVLDKSNPHYGWDIGDFYVSGYTTKTEYNGQDVILKNVGDEITLWFNLKQNVNALNENTALSINADDNWYDREFETERTNSGRGVLIIKHTNYKNETTAPIIYTNYLEACASLGANTKIQVFEEGDYEVALDYEIKEDKVVDKFYHYRISFKFIVRNGNCMVYPKDCKTGGELTNGALTDNGFILDLANSRYLNIIVTKETLSTSGDSLAQDTRFNKVARDGEVFDEEGIYTITVKNLYSGAEPTVKRIYVGSDPILRAYIINPNYSIAEIRQFVNNGASISSDGIISLSTATSSEVKSNDSNSGNNTPDKSTDNTSDSDADKKTISPAVIIIPIVILVLAGGAVSAFLILKKKKTTDTNNG